jgi:ribosomal protein S18 acetylase RimI-like enzyme
MVQVRKAVSADAELLSELNLAFNGVNRTAERVRQALLDHEPTTETVLIAEESGLIVGFVCFQTLRSICYDHPWAEITELYVRPSHRRSGAGLTLVSAAITGAEIAGASEVILRVNVKNDAARNLYAKAGLSVLPDVVLHIPLQNSS